MLGARWGEIDIEEAVWTVPADRMKGKREHRVPPSDRAMAILAEIGKFKTRELLAERLSEAIFFCAGLGRRGLVRPGRPCSRRRG